MRMKLYQRKPGDPAPAGQPDPYMIRVGDFYYVYATHDEGVQLYRSRMLTEGWEYLGLCYTRPGEKQFWAPAVMPFEGKYYLYYSSMPEGSEDTHQQRIQVAVGDSPEGPFAFVREMLPPFSIDAHAVSTDSGLYLFYSVNDYEAERAGTLIVADRLTDPCHVEGAPVVIVRPTIDEEIFQRDRFRKGQHWHTIEGAFYFREGDWHYVMYSGSAYTNETYFIGYSVAQGEGDLRNLAWRKHPDDHTYSPLVCRNAFVEGTGHNSVVREGDAYYVVYHGRDRDADRSQGDVRVMRADRMTVQGPELRVEITR